MAVCNHVSCHNKATHLRCLVISSRPPVSLSVEFLDTLPVCEIHAHTGSARSMIAPLMRKDMRDFLLAEQGEELDFNLAQVVPMAMTDPNVLAQLPAYGVMQ